MTHDQILNVVRTYIKDHQARVDALHALDLHAKIAARGPTYLMTELDRELRHARLACGIDAQLLGARDHFGEAAALYAVCAYVDGNPSEAEDRAKDAEAHADPRVVASITALVVARTNAHAAPDDSEKYLAHLEAIAQNAAVWQAVRHGLVG